MSANESRNVAASQLRDPQQVMSLSAESLPWDPSCLDASTTGEFWNILGNLGVTLFVTREYEHLVVALSCSDAGPNTSVLRVPHPSGLVADRTRNLLHVACTRNPNQIMELGSAEGFLRRGDREPNTGAVGLAPRRTRFFPGCLYTHDLAFVGSHLVGNAVGLNAVVDFDTSSVEWWPASIESVDGPDLSINLIQLNSIAAGATLPESYFTASTAKPGAHLPGNLEWKIDRQGVIFSGATREPVVTGLTRPHSARFHDNGSLWVDDSGYGTLNVVRGETASPIVALRGWTRGLCIIGELAFVGTSRVIPRYARYAPGLDTERSTCGVHVVDLATGTVVASLLWLSGDQIFAIDWLPSQISTGFLAGQTDSTGVATDNAWYSFAPRGSRFGPLSP